MTSPNPNDPYGVQPPVFSSASSAPPPGQPHPAQPQPGQPQPSQWGYAPQPGHAGYAPQPGQAGYAAPGQAGYATPGPSNSYATMQTPEGASGAPVEIGGGLGATFRWAWNVFAGNIAAFLVPAVIYAVLFAIGLTISFVIYFIAMGAVIVPASSKGEEPSPVLLTIVLILTGLLMVLIPAVLSAAWAAGAANAAAVAARGGRPTIGQGMFSAKALLTSLVLGVIIFITTIFPLPVIGGWISALFLSLVMPVVMLENVGLIEGIKRSCRLTLDNIGVVLLGALLSAVILYMVSMLMVTMVVVVPAQILVQFALYMVVTGRERAI